MMIGAHPGGLALTRRLLELAGWKDMAASPADGSDLQDTAESLEHSLQIKALDLGAGNGESVRYLRELGYHAEGIDRIADTKGADMVPKTGIGRTCPGEKRSAEDKDTEEAVTAGDMTALPFPDASYDLCLAECSVSVCGDGPAALREAFRALRPGGSLLLSDVFFQKEQAPCMSMEEPLTSACWDRAFARAGFLVQAVRDETALWREFFLESLWNDNADDAFCDFFKEAGKAGCGYFIACLQKPENAV